MKTQEEIKVLAGNLANPNVCKTDNWIEGYMQCQEDMTDKKLDVDDINEMALDYIINTGGLPDSIESLQYCLRKFYEQLNKRD